MSSSVSNISFRYHPEDEQLDDSYETSSSISTSNISIKSDGVNDEGSTTGPMLEKSPGRSVKKDENDKWKILRDVKVRIAKSVEEKLEEMKSERLKCQSKQRRSILSQMETSSVSDSEEQSESSLLSASDKSTKSAPESLIIPVTSEKADEKPESDESGTQESTPDRSTTPVPLIESFASDEGEKAKGIKGAVKKKKSKIKHDNLPAEKTAVSYSALVNKDLDTEEVEVGEEVCESSPMQGTGLGRELERLAHPSPAQQLMTFLYDWHLVVVPLAAILAHWLLQLPQYVVGCLVGVAGLLILQRLTALYQWLLGSESPKIHLKDMLPLMEVPIFRRNSCSMDTPHTVFEGWMNEYTKEYRPDTYHISLTDSVYVRLEGSKLRLSTTRGKVPKRALWNQPKYSLNFDRERLFDLSNCHVQLKPEGLIHRRVWSKKYPICIILSEKSRLGARYREHSEESVNPDAPWVEEDSYNLETQSDDSEDEQTVPYSSNGKDDGNLKVISDANTSDDHSPLGNLDESFVKVSPHHTKILNLFARADREKEMWYRRLFKATAIRKENTDNIKTSVVPQSPDSQPKPTLDYLPFMLALSQRTAAQLPTSKEKNSKSSMKTDLSISMEMMWLNAFLGRVLFDVFQDTNKISKIQDKIQHKLSAIKLPKLLERLEVTQLDLGQSVPIVQRASMPQIDSRGVWVDLDIVYEGGFRMTIDTKVNLQGTKQPDSPNSEGSPAKALTPVPGGEPMRKSAVYDSSVEDSAETSGEELDLSRLQDPGQGPVAQHKYMRLLDKVAQSKYVQQVADYTFIKKFVSGNSLQLIVEVKGLLGTLVLNIPPPPSDRLWYGFRKNPKLWLSAYPKVGQTALHLISRMIEKRLCLEFQRLLVLPNMDDLLIPIMNHNIPS